MLTADGSMPCARASRAESEITTDSPVLYFFVHKFPNELELVGRGAPLKPWNADTFYSDGPTGYTDYPALEEQAAAEQASRRERLTASDARSP